MSLSDELSAIQASIEGLQIKIVRSEARIICIDDKVNDLLHRGSKLEPAIPATAVYRGNELQLLHNIFNAVKAGEKIEAIKSVRLLTGCGLLEAKNTVELICGATP